MHHTLARAYGLFYRSTLPTPLAAVARQVRSEGLTYLSRGKLDKLGQALLEVERRDVPGVIIETGCALGGSAILLACAKSRARKLRIYDVFGMIPPPGDKDDQDVHDRYQVIASGKSLGLKGQRYYGYETDLFQRVSGNFERFGFSPLADHNVEMIAGLLQDTLAVDEPVSLAHIDVDWFDPVMTSLERIAPMVAPGGVMIIDDYFDWSGSRSATDEFLARTSLSFRKDPSAGSLALIRE
jgi:asparagine synthase (glutamine-hydrolysing)